MANRGGLGRGLSSLMSNTASEVSGAQLDNGTPGGAGNGPAVEVPLAKIVPNPNQPRRDFDEEKLAELADSIKKNGLIQPIVVRKHGIGYEIIAGERRYQASKRAGLDRVPVIVKDVDDAEMYRLALIENIQRDDLNPIEEAKGYKTLIAMNGVKSLGDLSELVSKSRSSISNIIRLLKLPEEVQDMVSDGRLTYATARAILAIDGEERQLALAQKAVEKGMATSEVEDYVKAVKAMDERMAQQQQQEQKAQGEDGQEAGPDSAPDAQQQLPDIAEIPGASINRAVARLNSAIPGGKVKVKGKNGRYKVEIPIANEEELDDFLAFFPDIDVEKQ